MTDAVYKFLTRPKRLRGKIRQTQSQIEGIRLSILPSAIRYDKDKVQTSNSADPMAEYIAKLAGLEEKLNKLCQEYIKAQDDIVAVTGKLSNDGATIIQMRYISFDDFNTIAREISLSERQMFRLYKEACESLDDIIRCQ